jgi:hypothetical protein
MQALEELRCHFAHMGEDAAFPVDVQGLDRDRCRDRVSTVSEAVPECADGAALVEHGLIHGLIHDHRRDRQITRRQGLGAGERLGLHIECLRAPIISGSSEAANNFIVDQQYFVPVEDGLDFFEVGGGRNDHHRRRP